MILHIALGPTPFARLRALAVLVQTGALTRAGHRPGRIYGQLSCRSGKRMKAENRVFFRNEAEALAAGYRPCAVCLPAAYNAWKTRESPFAD